jgi:hypothetical protein
MIQWSNNGTNQIKTIVITLLHISTKVGYSSQTKSLWDFKSELNSLHFSDFTMVKVISL